MGRGWERAWVWLGKRRKEVGGIGERVCLGACP